MQIACLGGIPILAPELGSVAITTAWTDPLGHLAFMWRSPYCYHHVYSPHFLPPGPSQPSLCIHHCWLDVPLDNYEHLLMALCRIAILSIDINSRIAGSWDSLMSPLTSPLISFPNFKGAIFWIVTGRRDFLSRDLPEHHRWKWIHWEFLLWMCLFVISRLTWSGDFAARNDQISSC